MNTRRNFLSKLTAAAALSPLGALAAERNKRRLSYQEAFNFLCPPYLQALTPEAVSILTITSRPSFTWVEFGENAFDRKAYSNQEGLIEANTRLFHMPLQGLKPGTVYQYRVVSREIELFEPYKLVYGREITSATYSFKTPVANAENVSCLILNDIHDRPHSFKQLIDINGNNPYNFVVLNGDMFDFQTDEQQMLDHLLLPLTSLFASQTPFIMSRGNHETRGKYAREFKDYFRYPQQSYYQAFKQGPVFWIVLDTGEDKADGDKEYSGLVSFDSFREQQALWLKQVMTSREFKKAPFRVVLMHIPPFHSGEWHGTTHCRQLFDPLFREHKVDVVISGHTHRYGVHLPDNSHSYPIVIGGGPKDGNRTIMRLNADSKQLQLKMMLDNGSEVGALNLKAK